MSKRRLFALSLSLMTTMGWTSWDGAFSLQSSTTPGISQNGSEVESSLLLRKAFEVSFDVTASDERLRVRGAMTERSSRSLSRLALSKEPFELLLRVCLWGWVTTERLQLGFERMELLTEAMTKGLAVVMEVKLLCTQTFDVFDRNNKVMRKRRRPTPRMLRARCMFSGRDASLSQ